MKSFKYVVKRDGAKEAFSVDKIVEAIAKAGESSGEFTHATAKKLALKVLVLLSNIYEDSDTPTVEKIQDVVEEMLLASFYKKTAKLFILFREHQTQSREIINHFNSSLIDKYIGKSDWRVSENSNMGFSLQGMNAFISNEITSIYWLNKIYTPQIKNAHVSGDIHLHDLGNLASYCVGWDLQDLLVEGFKGDPTKVQSAPARHLRSALGQIVNFFYTTAGETAGAQALSNFDTYLAPFIRYDNLSKEQVKQCLQEFMYNCNVPTRVGFQPPFTNITLDLTIPHHLANQAVIIGGKLMDKKYKEFQAEMDLFNEVLLEIMYEGDANGKVFSFPIPTINITKDFNWDNPKLDILWKITAKYGIPYFANFVNSDMSPEDCRSLCCRLRIDTKSLQTRHGGLFASAPLTGCYDEKTEVLTEGGWKLFKDLTTKERVFTLADDNSIQLHIPDKLFKYDYDGEMIHFKAKSLDLLVTPNHNMVVDSKLAGGRYTRKFIKAEDISPHCHFIPKKGIWRGKEKEFFCLPPAMLNHGTGPQSKMSLDEINCVRALREEGKTYQKIADKFNCDKVTIFNICNDVDYGNHKIYSRASSSLNICMDDWLKFFGFWLAEGCVVDTDHSNNSCVYKTIITQKKENVRKEIQQVLEALPFEYSIEGINYVIYNKQLWAYLKQFGDCYSKYIPSDLLGLSARQLTILLDWMMLGDGCTSSNKQRTYYTSSKALVEDTQEIFMKLGYMGTLRERKSKKINIRGKEYTTKACYEISTQKTSHYKLRKESTQKEYYKGRVYCCEVKNHTLFVRRNGKVAWCGNSVGVVTVNMARLGYKCKSEKEFKEELEKLLILAKESLEIKRKCVEGLTEKGLYPYVKYYLRNVQKKTGKYWANHFSTIGLVGMNEACENLLKKNIASEEGKTFALRILNFMKTKLLDFQKETGNFYNLEATPAEGTSYRLARLDKKLFPEIKCANEGAHPFYTNSTMLPVGYTDSIFETLRLQDNLISTYTGGSVLHLFIGEKINDYNGVKNLIKKIFTSFKVPYISITPTFSICPDHGYIAGEHKTCPKCKKVCEVYSRIVGYLRPVSQWNDGKKAEYKMRRTLKIDEH